MAACSSCRCAPHMHAHYHACICTHAHSHARTHMLAHAHRTPRMTHLPPSDRGRQPRALVANIHAENFDFRPQTAAREMAPEHIQTKNHCGRVCVHMYVCAFMYVCMHECMYMPRFTSMVPVKFCSQFICMYDVYIYVCKICVSIYECMYAYL